MIYDTRFMSPAQEFLRKNLFSAVDLSWRIIYIIKKRAIGISPMARFILL